jgi:hypothetical protein
MPPRRPASRSIATSDIGSHGRRRRAILLTAALLVVAGCSLTSTGLGPPDKVQVGRWVATRTFETDGVSRITGDAALDIARQFLVDMERGRIHPYAPGLALGNPVAAGFVPSMIKLEVPGGSSMAMPAQDSWVFEFGRPGSGAVVIVNADAGVVSESAST